MMVFASYIFYSELIHVRNVAREESHENTKNMCHYAATWAIRLFDAAMGIMAFGLQLCALVIYAKK